MTSQVDKWVGFNKESIDEVVGWLNQGQITRTLSQTPKKIEAQFGQGPEFDESISCVKGGPGQWSLLGLAEANVDSRRPCWKQNP